MSDFSCSKCGHRWGDKFNISPCPNCMGLGIPDPNCTCPHMRKAFGGRLNVRIETNPKCPVHGDDSSSRPPSL